MTADPSYNVKVYHKQGGDQMVVASGGSILIQTGGQILPDGGTLPSALTKAVTTGSTNSTPYGFATAAQGDALVTAVNAIIDVLKNAGLTA